MVTPQSNFPAWRVSDVQNWVNNAQPVPTDDEIREACRGFGIDDNGFILVVKRRLNDHLNTLKPSSIAAWNPDMLTTGRTTTGPEPYWPEHTPRTTWRQTMNNNRWIGLAILGILLLLLCGWISIGVNLPGRVGLALGQTPGFVATGTHNNAGELFYTNPGSPGVLFINRDGNYVPENQVATATAVTIVAATNTPVPVVQQPTMAPSSPSGGGTQPNGGGQQPPATGSSWTPAQKCEWLRSNFPQSTSGVQSLGAQLAGVQTQRIATHLYPCDTVNTAFDGFIILGPNEGYNGSFTIAVPAHGAVDAYPGATFTGRSMQIGSETIRAFDGSVTAQRATYWPWLDENPPTASSSTMPPAQPAAQAIPAATPPGDVQCLDPVTLAMQKKWMKPGDKPNWADTQYGGLRVELKSTDQLPPKWEAISSGRTIKENDTDRTMVIGWWSIYTPYDCRAQYKFSK